MELVLQWSKLRMLVDGASYNDIYGDDENDYGSEESNFKRETVTKDKDTETQKEKEKICRACDKKSSLYILQQHLFIQSNALPSHGQSSCSRSV